MSLTKSICLLSLSFCFLHISYFVLLFNMVLAIGTKVTGSNVVFVIYFSFLIKYFWCLGFTY